MPAWKEDNLKAFMDRLGNDIKILYKGLKNEITFIEIKDEKQLYGKVLPMKLSQEEVVKSVNLTKEDDRLTKKGINSGKEEGEGSQVDQNVNSSVEDIPVQDKSAEKVVDDGPKDAFLKGIHVKILDRCRLAPKKYQKTRQA